MSQRGLSSLLLLVLALSASGMAQAQWKWRDAKGQVQYSDRAPPASVPDKDVLQRPPGQAGLVLLPMGAPNPVAGATPAASAVAASRPASGSAPRLVSGDEARKRADEAAQRKNAEDALARQRAENCQQARDQIRLLQDGVRVARMNAKGEREILDDAQRARELARAQAAQASDCR
jgi:hypothetical protein